MYLSIPPLVEVFLVNEALVDMRRIVRAALAVLQLGSDAAKASGNRDMLARADRAANRIGTTMDMERVQDTHMATILILAKDVNVKKLSFPEDDLAKLLLYARHRLGLRVRGGEEI